MDISLIVDGGASPQAPPGKITESPPPKEEFEKTLQTAKEETPGEVAETEPNAQLQTLDSENEETGTKTSVDAIGAPIQIDPFILAQLLLVGIAPIQESNQSMPAPQVQLTAELLKIELPSNPLSSSINSFRNLESGLAYESLPQSTESTQALALDPKSNQTLSALICSTFEEAITPSSTGEVKVAVNPMSVNPTTVNPTPVNPTPPNSSSANPTAPRTVEPKFMVPLLMPAPEKEILNISSVQSKVIVPITEVATPRLVANISGPQSKTLTTTDNFKLDKSKGVEKAVDGVAVVEQTAEDTATILDSQTKDSKEKEKGTDGSQLSKPDIQQKSVTSTTTQDQPLTVTGKMTSQERQVMVDTIAKKIDELAIKSVRNEVRVEMNPPELGSVIVNIRKDMAGVTATLNASNEPLRQALHESRNDLAGALADRNIGQVRIEVRAASADSMSMGQQFNQAQSQNQSQNHHPRHTAQSVEKRALESNDQVDQPRARRAVTTLLDMEI